ncbi:MAG: cellulase family glycosylhydrolase [Clostridia bacterium]|nr:cellulase family glycosylhydrolase [Clostridia bacterium]
MKKFVGFERGMGIGGWLTNYKRFNVLPMHRRLPLTVGDMEHFKTYITESDVKYIKSLKLDHIRVGFDQVVLESEPYVYREEIFVLIDNFIGWCKKYNLNVVLNLHKAVGNYCDIKEDKELLDDDELQNRFIALWKQFENRYSSDNEVVFELLNEVRDVDPEKWNALAEKTIIELRKLNKDRKIIIGSTAWNDPDTLKYLKVYDDDNIIYTFHNYEPFEFTHQRGVLQERTLYYNRIMEYPSNDIERYRDYKAFVENNHDAYKGLDKMDITFIRRRLQPAVDFTKAHPDKILWCGEFGTIRHADIKWRENYMRDMITVLKENDIPYCVWNYLSTPNDGNRFSLVDDVTRKILSKKLAKIIRGEV